MPRPRRDASSNSFTSPPNPIPQQSSFQFLRYLQELYHIRASPGQCVLPLAAVSPSSSSTRSCEVCHRPLQSVVSFLPRREMRALELLSEWVDVDECRLLTPSYHLDYIPDLMLEAATVTALSLDENNISFLPEAIGGFTLLTELFSVCDNALTDIPPCVGNMTKLTCLRLSGNSLVELDALSSMVLLRTFLVDHNSLSAFNRSFSTMTCLEVLSLSITDPRGYQVGLISSIASADARKPHVLPGPEVIEGRRRKSSTT